MCQLAVNNYVLYRLLICVTVRITTQKSSLTQTRDAVLAFHSKLTPFKKGQSGNPGGKPKALFTKEKVEAIFQSMAAMPEDKLQELVDNPSTPVIQKAAARTWLKVAQDGDMAEIRRILDSAVGKLREELYSEGYSFTQELKSLSDKELVELAKQEIPLLIEGKE